jgi:hypothetical protein
VQVCPVPQAVPHVPQFLLSVCVFVHPPVLQKVSALAVHPHTPAVHAPPLPQAFPQLPQLLLSVCVLLHVPLQFVWVPWHAGPSVPVSLALPESTLPESPPSLPLPLPLASASPVELSTPPLELLLLSAVVESPPLSVEPSWPPLLLLLASLPLLLALASSPAHWLGQLAVAQVCTALAAAWQLPVVSLDAQLLALPPVAQTQLT